VDLTAVSMDVIYLRAPLLAAGGTQADIESLLAGHQMEPILTGLQQDSAIRKQVEKECSSPIVTMLAFMQASCCASGG